MGQLKSKVWAVIIGGGKRNTWVRELGVIHAPHKPSEKWLRKDARRKLASSLAGN